MGLLRSKSQLGAHEKKSTGALRKDSAVAERSANTAAIESQRQKSVSSQERPRTAHSQFDRPKTADRPDKVHDRPKTADRQQTADRRRSFSRPRTANSASSAPKNRDKEREREEAEVAMPTQTLEYKTGKDTYNFPTPSPRLQPPHAAPHQAAPARSPLGATVVDDSPRIGMAIGSPGQMPPQWGRSHTIDHLSKKLPARPPPNRAKTEASPQPEPVEQTPKKKSSWKNLGGIFGRKPSTRSPAPEPFYKLQPPREQDEQPAPSRPLHTTARQEALSPAFSPGGDRSPLPKTTGHRRTPSTTRGMTRLERRAQADRAAFMEQEKKEEPKEQRVVRTPSNGQRDGTSPNSGAGAEPRTSEDIFKSLDAIGKRNDSPLSVNDGTGPLRLDLDIPDHHMERYSVMFEKFLNGDDKRPSILERRQSKLQKKRSLKRLVETNNRDRMDAPAVPQRSATSPHLTSRMPSLSIKTGKKVRSPKPSPLGEAEQPATAVHRPRPVKRSNTAPAKTESPVRRNFSKPRMVVVAEPSAENESVAGSASRARGISMYSENSLPPTPTSDDVRDTDALLDTTPASQSLTSVNKTKHEADSSGTWDMLTADPNTKLVPQRRVSLARREPNLPSTSGDHDPYRRVKSPEDLESRVVQVSVARQVSVSKARTTVRQAVDVKQPLRPRVVELGKNRKSTMVLIEGGEES